MSSFSSTESQARPRARCIAFRFAPIAALTTLVACIADQGSSRIETEGGTTIDGGAGDDAMIGPDVGTQDAGAEPSAPSVTRKLEGLANDAWVITDENGKRLAKRDDARSLRTLREQGWTPQRVRDALQMP